MLLKHNLLAPYNCCCYLQRAPCGRVASGSDYIITQSEQEARVTFLSKLVDVDIRAKTLNDTSAVQALRALQVSNTSFVELADIA